MSVPAGRGLRLTVLTAGLALAPALPAAEGASDWLLRLSSAARSSNYQGVMIYKGDDALETFHVTHRYEDGRERERVQSLTGEVREVLKQNGNLTCILPKATPLTLTQPTPKDLFPSLSVHRIALIEERYEIKELPTERVAGRPCRGVRVAPRDELRYGYEIFADAETAVPLKVSLVRADGRVIEQMFFTGIEFPTRIPDTAFNTALGPEEVRHASTVAADVIAQVQKDAPPAQPEPPELAAVTNKLPAGFRVVRRELRELPNGRGRVEHVVLSDGLSAVSVYRALQPVQGPAAPQRLDQMGAVNAYSRVAGRLHITVVGEAPRQTVKMIGDSFETIAAPADMLIPAEPARH